MKTYQRAFLTGLLFCIAFVSDVAASTKNIFNRYKETLVQVRLIDTSTQSKSIIGSGFFVNRDGMIVTNYHVISKHAFKPQQYRIEVMARGDKVVDAKLINFDVIHDLAILQAEIKPKRYLHIQSKKLSKGERIYSLGNPLDLGMTITEGTYNGLTDDTMHERILLSSAINSGMSGGPSITKNGKVVGVNVATAGNSIGFLVPSRYLKELIKRTDNSVPDNFLYLIRDQVITNQDKYIGDILAQPLKTKLLGDYQVPGKIADYLTCWGDSIDEENLYRASDTICSLKNDIYLNTRTRTGKISYIHRYVRGKQINRFRFYYILQSYFEVPDVDVTGRKEQFSDFSCHTDFTEKNGIVFKSSFCLRAYKKLPELYDMIYVAASLTSDNEAIITNLLLSGVTYENAIRMGREYINAFAWDPDNGE